MVSSNYVHFLCVTSHSYANRNWNVWDDEFGCSIYALLFSPFNRAIVVLCRTCALLFSPHVIVSVESVVFILFKLKAQSKMSGHHKAYVCMFSKQRRQSPAPNGQKKQDKRNNRIEQNVRFYFYLNCANRASEGTRAHLPFSKCTSSNFPFSSKFQSPPITFGKVPRGKIRSFSISLWRFGRWMFFFFVLSVTCLFSPRFMTACVAHFLASRLNIEIILSF